MTPPGPEGKEWEADGKAGGDRACEEWLALQPKLSLPLCSCLLPRCVNPFISDCAVPSLGPSFLLLFYKPCHPC